jgi:hypothetical protein
MISVGLVVAAELATIAFVALLAVRAVRRVRRHGGAVTPITGSFEDTLAAVIPRRAARLLLFELHGWRALSRLVRKHGGARELEFSYASDLTLLMAAMLGLTVLETPAFLFLGMLLLPWVWLKVALIVLDLYAVWFVASFWAGMITFPHAVRDGALHLRVALLAGTVIPIRVIESAALERRHWPGLLGPVVRDAMAGFPVAGSTEIALHLNQPATVWRVFGRDVTVTEIHVHADDPRRMMTALSAAIAGAQVS